MGYLNYNLEKVASVVEEGMEKQALSLGALIRMGGNATTRGKALHFIKRLQQRNRALANSDNIMSRNNQFVKARQSKLGEAADMEQAYGKPGPNSRELARLQSRRIPDNNADATRFLSNAVPILDSQHVGRWLQARHAPMGSGDLTNIVNNLRAGWGNTFV